MHGDRFTVYYSVGGGTQRAGSVDFWLTAKDLRDATFAADQNIRACWVMRDNPSLGLQPDARGFTLRRNKRGRTYSTSGVLT